MLAVGIVISAVIVTGAIGSMLYLWDDFTPRNYFDD